jgi:hypothetical protein
MTSIGSNNSSLSSMFGSAFGRFDRNKDRGLDSEEFKASGEVRKPGVAVDENGNPLTAFTTRMNTGSDGEIGEEETQSANLLKPVTMTDSTFNAMWQYLSTRSERSELASSTPYVADDETEV